MNKTAKLWAVLLILVSILLFAGSKKQEENRGSFTVRIVPGPEWIHAFSLFIKNPPQYALWLEDESGRYMGTVYVTGKIAKAGWIASKGNRRVEALPVWTHKRNIRMPDGLLQPTRENPVIDSETGATPRAGQELTFSPGAGLTRFWICFEVNHSTDFNDTWPKKAKPEDAGWSGGKEGSGQPSLIYKILVDEKDPGPWPLILAGHGSPDGSDGKIYPDVSRITTAGNIVGPLIVEKE